MLKAYKRLWNSDRGNVLVIVGATLPLLVGAAGFATDTIEWTLWKRQLQRAADSGAIAGVYTRLKTDTQSAVESAVNTDLSLNNHTDIPNAAGYPQIVRPADNGNMRRQVTVTLQISKSLPFSSIFLSVAPVIRAVATAASVPGADEYCVVGLDPSVSATGVEITGSTDLDLGDCSLIANSTNPTTAASNGSSANGGSGSKVTARSLAAAGGVQYSSNWNVKDYDPNSPAIPDPYASIPAPKSSDCSKTITISSKSQDYPIDRTSTATPGTLDTAGQTVCITGDVNVAGSLTLQSNVTYVLNGGNLTMNSTGTSLNCTNCTIALTNFTDPTKTGNIKLNGGNLNISAPTIDGPYKGIALYQDRRAIDTGKKTQNQINGNSSAAVTGIVYIPNQSLLYNGGGNVTAVCLQIVGKRVEFSGSSKIKVSNQCAGAGIPQIGGGQRVRLVA